MLGKRLIYKRGVMIAIAVIALMTLTAGVAAAASAKAKNINAVAGVTGVGLSETSTVKSDFRIKDDVIKSVQIRTKGENVGGQVYGFDVDSCKEKGKHSDGACLAAAELLGGATIASTHNSVARLTVVDATAGTLTGTLKGELKSNLSVTSLGGDVLDGKANLRIRSKGELSTYVCLLGVAGDGITQIPGPIQACVDSPGPNSIGFYDADELFGNGLYPLGGGPVLVPVDLHVTDTGSFSVKSDTTGTKFSGKIQVVIDAPPTTPEHGPFAGTMTITKGEATFSVDEAADDDDDDDDDDD